MKYLLGTLRKKRAYNKRIYFHCENQFDYCALTNSYTGLYYFITYNICGFKLREIIKDKN